MTEELPPGQAEFQNAAQVSGSWARYWMQRLADSTTVVNDGTGARFTPGVLRELHTELLDFDNDALKLLIVAALINGSALLHEELRRH